MITEHDKIFKNLSAQQVLTLATSQQQGDWVDIKHLLTTSPGDLFLEIEKSQLREKDNTANLVSEKWRPFLKKQKPILLLDASRGVPGDIGFLHLLLYETHKIIEGALLTAFITGSERGYVYISAEYKEVFGVVQKALEECYAQNLLGDNILESGVSFHLHVHLGSRDYVGHHAQEMIDSLAGEKQPFGRLFEAPVLIHKIETVASLPAILKRGAEWFCTLGTPYSRGTKIFAFLGHVNKPCVVEESFGISLKTSIEKHAAGIKGGWPHLNFVFPGGLENSFLPKALCEPLMLSYEGVGAVHGCLGSGSVVVVNSSVDLMMVTRSSMNFFQRVPSSCCLFCTKGIKKCVDLLQPLQHVGQEETDGKIASYLSDLCQKIENRCSCGYASHGLSPLRGYLLHINNTLAAMSEGEGIRYGI
jgi:NADH:ubiquinone oxidoreductase subunit F (NADH-binding)